MTSFGGAEIVTVQRTDWVEEQVARLFGFPLTAETVLLRPTRRDGRLDREVCDLLLALRRDGVVFSLKSQADPTAREGAALDHWCAKAAADAAGQLRGAVRTLAGEPFWCEHRRRGRVEIEAGTLTVRHAVALLETADEVILPTDLPESTTTGVPLTYLSTNDLLNLVMELRAFPELVAYLDARLALPTALRTRIGNEQLLYAYYLLNEEDFGDCQTLDDARALNGDRRAELQERLRRKRALDHYALIIEHVSNALATRRPDYATGLDAATLAAFDPAPTRRNYLRLQEELCDLRLGARRLLGRAIAEARENVASSPTAQEMSYIAVPDAKPNFVYVLASSRGLDPQPVIGRAMVLLRGALAFYGKRRGMVIVDRDGASYEVGYVEMARSTDAETEAGRQLFGGRRLREFDASTLPRGDAMP